MARGMCASCKMPLDRSVVMFRRGNWISDLPNEVATVQALIDANRRTGHDAGIASRDFSAKGKRKFEIAWITNELVSHRWNVSLPRRRFGTAQPQSLQEKWRERWHSTPRGRNR